METARLYMALPMIQLVLSSYENHMEGTVELLWFSPVARRPEWQGVSFQFYLSSIYHSGQDERRSVSSNSKFPFCATKSLYYNLIVSMQSILLLLQSLLLLVMQ